MDQVLPKLGEAVASMKQLDCGLFISTWRVGYQVRSMAHSKLLATRPALVPLRQVSTGKPAHKASLVVVCIAWRGVEKKIRQRMSIQMGVEVESRREYQPFSIDSCPLCFPAQIADRILIVAQ